MALRASTGTRALVSCIFACIVVIGTRRLRRQLSRRRVQDFPGFQPISDQIYIQKRVVSSPDGVGQEESPTTVVIYGWGDSIPKHLAKYAEGYCALFPRVAEVIVVLSPILRALHQTLDQRIKAMQPLVDALGPPDGKQQLLLHTMSNTGGINLTATLQAYRERHGVPLPYRLSVADSAPGSTDFRTQVGRWSRAMALGTANWFPWPFGVTRALWYVFLCGNYAVERVTGREPSGANSTKASNDPRLVQRGRRLYVYSKADDLVYWEDIEKHVATAIQLGYDVDTCVFESSNHVGHMKMHPQEYWSAIKKSWDASRSL